MPRRTESARSFKISEHKNNHPLAKLTDGYYDMPYIIIYFTRKSSETLALAHLRQCASTHYILQSAPNARGNQS